VGTAADFALRLAAAGAGGILTLLLLARLRPADARPVRTTRLHPLDLLAAAALLFGLRALGFALLGPPGAAAAPAAVLRLAGEVALVLLFLRWRSGPTGWFPRPEATRSDPRPGGGWAMTVYLAALPALLGVAWLNLLLVEVFTGRPPAEEILSGFTALSAGEQLLTALLAALLMPLLEEMLFRGFLMRTLATRREHGPVRALGFSALVFALAHGPAMWLPTFVLGALLAWIDLHAGDLRRAVLVHVAHNTLVLLVTERVAPLA
jgi:membrane protease YdiL (CAAX protease family)